MAVVRKKQDDTNLKILRELVTTGGGNRQCFDCGQKGPTYVNMTIGSFVCTRCSGVLRGLTPPHRVKSISMATFTPEEIEFVKSHGNDVCAKTWLGLWDPKRIIHQDQRELMIDKYERKRYYLEPASPLKSITTNTKLSSGLSSSSGNVSMNSSHNSSSTNSSNNNINVNNNNNNNISYQQQMNKNNSSLYNNSSNSSSNSNHHHRHNNNNNKSSINDNNFKNITLTSPNSLRITSNGLSSSSNNSLHRQKANYNYMNGNVNNSNNNISINSNGGNHNENHSNGGLMMNGFNGTGGGEGKRQQILGKNNLNSINTGQMEHHQQQRQGFTPDSDFVADFSAANIFNATSGGTAGEGGVGGLTAGSNSNLNGFKIQNGIINGGKNFPAKTVNGTADNGTMNANENFADFDHAPIYNAAGLPVSSSIGGNLSSSATFNSNGNGRAPPADRYAALKDLDEQLRESKAAAAVADAFSNMQAQQQSAAATSVNPFKTVNPATHSQPTQIVNPFQTTTFNHQSSSTSATTAGFLGVTNTTGGNGIGSTTGAQFSFQQQHPQQLTGFNNGFTGEILQQQAAMTSLFTNGTMSVGGGVGGNGNCGFGGYLDGAVPLNVAAPIQQQSLVAATGSTMPNVKNPFTGSLLSSNNPFL